MKKKSAIFVAVFVLTIGLAFVLVWRLLFTESAVLSSEEIRKIVLEQYPGEILELTHGEGIYTMKLLHKQGEYELIVNESSGEVVSLVQTAGPDENPHEKEPLLFDEVKIKEIVLTHINGELVSLKLTEKEPPVYEAVVLTESEKTTINLDAKSGEIISSKTETNNEVAKVLTDAEAKEVAIKHVNGVEVDDIEFVENGNQPYYLVEINLANDEEAKVQVNAISGDVMSVTWDD